MISHVEGQGKLHEEIPFFAYNEQQSKLARGSQDTPHSARETARWQKSKRGIRVGDILRNSYSQKISRT